MINATHIIHTDSYVERKKRRQQKGKYITKKEKCLQFLHDREDHTCCRKTPSDWCRSLIYHVLFLAVNVAVFLIIIWCMEKQDMATWDKSYIETNLGPGFHVFPTTLNNLPNGFIWYLKSGVDSDTNRRAYRYIEAIREQLDEQDELCQAARRKNIFCGFNRTLLGPCGTGNFGYDTGEPCVYLKLNRMKNWEPARYKTMPKDVPEKLQKIISKKRKCLWVHCQGKTDYDAEKFGKLKYFPEPAFHEDYFPQLPEYRINPVVAVQLKNVKKGFAIILNCQLFAANLVVRENSNVDSYYYIGM